MLKKVVLIYMNKSGEISLPFCATRGQSKYKWLCVHQSVFHTIVCHQNFNLAIFQTTGGKAFLFMAIVIIVTSYFQYNRHVDAV